MIGNDALDAPPRMVTLSGTETAIVLELLRAITIPPNGALSVSVTVPLDGVPPTTESEPSEREERSGAFRFKVAVLLVAPSEAVMSTVVWVATAVVVIVNEPDVAPAATVTLAGTEAMVGLALVRANTRPPVGAGPLNVTVPVELVPPITEVGFNASAERAAAVTVRVAV